MPGRSDKILDYATPPVNEVAVGVRFEQIGGLRLPHLGLFWSRVREEFPRCEHAAPLVTEGALILDPSTGGPIPRVWLISASERELIQLQSDAFLFNWRRIEESDAYPRFSHVVSQFRRFFGMWRDFVADELGVKVVLTVGELTYINAIPKGEGWTEFGNLGALLPDFAWRQQTRYLPQPSAVAFNLEFPIETNDGRLVVRVHPAKRKSDRADLVRLELVARRSFTADNQTELEGWLTMGRESIVRAFADLTDERVQRDVWGLDSNAK